MENLCKYIYDKDATDRLRTRAILCHVYHHALHDNWFQARDLVLMSHLQETIQHSDPPTQVYPVYDLFLNSLDLLILIKIITDSLQSYHGSYWLMRISSR